MQASHCLKIFQSTVPLFYLLQLVPGLCQVYLRDDSRMMATCLAGVQKNTCKALISFSENSTTPPLACEKNLS